MTLAAGLRVECLPLPLSEAFMASSGRLRNLECSSSGSMTKLDGGQLEGSCSFGSFTESRTLTS